MTTPEVLFSVVTPVYEPPVDALREMILSVREQDYDSWELILVDDCSPSESVREEIRRHVAADSRVRLIERPVNGGIVAASNDGVAEARGDFIALVDHDDLIVKTALSTVASAIRDNPEVDYLYSDEDKLGADGEFYDLFQKPTWSPERLRSQMYTSHLGVLRTDLVREVGGFRPGFDGSQDHDLVLRVTERARAVCHIPEVLYHWRVVPGSAAGQVDAKPYAWLAGQRAVQSHVDRLGLRAKVELGATQGTYDLRRELDPRTFVSVVIPTRGSSGYIWGEKRCFVVEAVRSVLAHTKHQLLEFVVVHDSSTPQVVLDELTEIVGERLVLVEYVSEFNFSDKCNTGFLASRGDVVVMLNDDVQVVSDNFIEQLVAPLSEGDVGMTGARLLFPDNTIQHAGHAYYQRHLRHPFMGSPAEEVGYLGVLRVNREVSGLTAACVAVRREVFDEVGGFCELLPANFNDVDFSLKILSAGYRNVWLSEVVLYHFESKTRVPVVHPWETALIYSRWDVAGVDRYLPGLVE